MSKKWAALVLLSVIFVITIGVAMADVGIMPLYMHI